MGLKPVNFWFAGRHSNHRATPTRAQVHFFRSQLHINNYSVSQEDSVNCLGFVKIVFALGIRQNMLAPHFSVYLGEGKLML